MEYRRLGCTGISVSPLCLGGINFGSRSDEEAEQSVSIVRAAIDAGINFIDTADVYSQGQSEEIIGRAIVGHRDDLILATKVARAGMGPGINQQGTSRSWIIKSCENSLRRLGTDYIDLYQVHWPYPEIEIDETLSALSDLIHQGKVRYIGSSNFLPSSIVEAQWVAERRSRERFVCEQPPYSLVVRGIERDVLPTCERYGMGVITWGPLNGGWLSGKWRNGTGEIESRRAKFVPGRYDMSLKENQAKLDVVTALDDLATDAGISLIHMALAFVMNHRSVTSAILGPRTLEHLVSHLGATEVTLDPDLLDQIDAIVPPGVNLRFADNGYAPPELERAGLRRRSR